MPQQKERILDILYDGAYEGVVKTTSVLATLSHGILTSFGNHVLRSHAWYHHEAVLLKRTGRRRRGKPDHKI